jgi:hypothetical protein
MRTGMRNDKMNTPSKAGYLRTAAFMVSLILVVASGYGQDQKQSTNSPPLDLKAGGVNHDALRKALVLGAKADEIRGKIGEPDSIREMSDGVISWRYGVKPFPADDEMKGTIVLGINLILTNQHLSRWSCAYMDMPEDKRTVSKESVTFKSPDNLPPVMKIYVVSDVPITEGRFIDTTRFPKLGFIPASPNLELHAIKTATLEDQITRKPDGTELSTWTLAIRLTETEGQKLQSLSASNLSKTLLIAVDDDLVSAPRLNSPLGTNFEITGDITDSDLRKLLRKHFRFTK